MKLAPWMIILGLVFIVLASLIPLRVSSISELELGDPDKLSFKKPYVSQELNMSDSENFFGFEQSTLKALLKPKSISEFDKKFPRLQKEIGNWVTWQKNRKAKMLFPVEDSRGAPTLALLKLVTILYLEKRFTGTFSSELLESRDIAPAKTYGRVEDALMSLLVLSTKYNFMELSTILGSVDSISTLKACAGLLQRIPDKKTELLLIHEATPVTLMPKLYDRIQRRGIQEWDDALKLMEMNIDSYVYWLADGRSIRKDWQREWWNFGSKFLPISGIKSLGKGGVIMTFLLLIFGVILVFWNWIPSNKGSLGLRIGSSLLLCLLLGLSLEWMPRGVGQDLSLKLTGAAKKPSIPKVITPQPEVTEDIMKELPIESIQLMLIFLGIQILIFIWSCIQINRVSKSEGATDLKLKLLENEDMLFDMGLYIGLGGTVLSLIFMVMGNENQGLIAAYTSTLFGILEVAVFKIFILRPFKQKLIVGV